MRFKPAVRENTFLLIALAGASGSGKTYSAMELATGIGDGARFAFIDTEARRGLHYADQFDFDHAELAPPFSPARYLEAVKEAEKAGYPCVVIDSMSHEHEGEGGLQDMADATGVKGPAAWARPKAEHKKMMNALLQMRCHVVFCLRAHEKIDMSKKDDRGKVIVESMGWQPVCEKNFMFEMTISMTLRPEAPGVYDPGLPKKIQDQHAPAFIPGQHITREAGRMLAAWAAGAEMNLDHKKLWDKARRISHEGPDAFAHFWRVMLDDAERLKLRPIKDELIANAKRAADAALPFDEPDATPSADQEHPDQP